MGVRGQIEKRSGVNDMRPRAPIGKRVTGGKPEMAQKVLNELARLKGINDGLRRELMNVREEIQELRDFVNALQRRRGPRAVEDQEDGKTESAAL